MTIDQLAAAAVERLKARINNCQVESFPDNREKYRFVHPTAALLVRYAGSRYPEDGILSLNSLVAQDRYIMLEVRILTRRLSGNGGAFLDAVRTALTGWEGPDCQRAYVVEEEFDRYDDKSITWQHHILFEAKTVHVEIREEEDLPALSSVTLRDSFAI